ncbi:hypothetical protein AOQ88_01830 [Candidatus Riesia sp. GBBU]|nr:hypothetical protein AOQ88_01830 [Candidatus Riesia sp. GBBU]
MLIFLQKKLNFYIFSELINSVFFRSILSFIVSFSILIISGRPTISLLKRIKFYQIIRKENPISHKKKTGTPTMGGVLLILSSFTSIILLTELNNSYIWYIILILFGYGIIGFIDDLRKINKKNSTGFSPKEKYIFQTAITLVLIFLILFFEEKSFFHKISVPFLKDFEKTIGVFFIPISYFTIIGSSNAANLSDGLDGLVSNILVSIIIYLFAISIISSDPEFSKNFKVIYNKKSIDLIIICSSIAGSILGFHWFNAYPANLFMGDVGSLSFGGVIGAVTVLLRQELMLFFIGGILVIETISVILQIFFFKVSKKKLFLMAPIHHHYELSGCPEQKIVNRLWIISLLLTILGISIVKKY